MQDKTNKRRILYSILAILFGIFFIVFGGYDDSPGAQLLGFIVIAIVGAIRNRKKNRDLQTMH